MATSIGEWRPAVNAAVSAAFAVAAAGIIN